jgi:tetratricopeptide (TPR) repeat protein
MQQGPRGCAQVLPFSRISSLLAVSLACALPSAACGGTQSGAKAPITADALGSVTPAAVDDAAFAPSAYRLLMGSDSGQARASLLAGTVARQLERARARFEADHPEQGFEALEGAFLLMRRGEFRREGLTRAAPVLQRGAAEAARLGQEGYSLALYSLLDGILPPGPEKSDVQTHLAAMAAFSQPSNSAGPVVRAGSDARVAAQRALLESSEERFADASKSLLVWLTRGIGAPDVPIRSNTDRDEALEAFRAIRGGGISLVALYLRHADPLGALSALDEAGLERAIADDLRARLEASAEDDDPDAWFDLFRLFDAALRDAQTALSLDPELFQGAAWGSAVSLFRAEPGSYRGSLPLATRLIDQGMAEVAPLVLNSGLQRGATPEQLSAALGLILNALVTEDQAGQHAAARRTFAGAAPLLELASSRAFAGRVAPSPARVRYVMGALEADRGQLAQAKPLLESALAAEPSIETLRVLAAIARQERNVKDALAHLARARAIAERLGNPLEEADLLHLEFEVLRDNGDAAGAKRALDAALTRVLDATRQSRTGPGQARAERLLARILEHFGEKAAVQRATERAYEASATDSGQLSATVIDSARRALTRRDLQSARAAVEHAVESNLPPEDLVYVALWLRLLEQELAVPSDGSVEDAFTAMDDARGWSGSLRAWGRGKLGDAELFGAARDAAQRTEALFYTAMARRVRGDRSADADLEKVATSEAVNLVEIGIARDLLALRAGTEKGLKLPAGVSLP